MVSIILPPRIPEPNRHQVFYMTMCSYTPTSGTLNGCTGDFRTDVLYLFYQPHPPRWVGWVVFGFTNGLTIMFTFLGPAIYRTSDFCECQCFPLLTLFLNRGANRRHLWCWITSEYNLARVTMGYMIVSLRVSLTTYGALTVCNCSSLLPLASPFMPWCSSV